jgi:hypothetical protein
LVTDRFLKTSSSPVDGEAVGVVTIGALVGTVVGAIVGTIVAVGGMVGASVGLGAVCGVPWDAKTTVGLRRTSGVGETAANGVA